MNLISNKHITRRPIYYIIHHRYLHLFWSITAKLFNHNLCPFNPSPAVLFNLNFHPALEILSRYRDPRLRVAYDRRLDIPHDPKKIKTKGFSTFFYPTGYSE